MAKCRSKTLSPEHTQSWIQHTLNGLCGRSGYRGLGLSSSGPLSWEKTPAG